MVEHPAPHDAPTRLSRRTALAAAVAGFAATGVVGVPALAQGATPVASPVTAEDEAAYLFVQAGFTAGTLTAQDDGTYLLALSTAPALTIYFSDRPDRVVGTLSTLRFLGMMGFNSDDPPNAALVIQVSEDESDIIVMELTAPLYDPGTLSLIYTATVLEGIDQLESTSAGFEEVPMTAETIPSEFGSCTLFIDSLMGCSPWDPRC